MNPHEWLRSITDDGPNAIARRAAISERTLYSQLERGALSVPNILKVCRAYDSNPIRALIDWGHIDAAWASVPDVEAALRLASDEQLTDEVLRRLRIVRDHPLYDTPVDELALRRAPTPPTFDDGAGDVGSLPMVADSSPDHPEEDCEDYP